MKLKQQPDNEFTEQHIANILNEIGDVAVWYENSVAEDTDDNSSIQIQTNPTKRIELGFTAAGKKNVKYVEIDPHTPIGTMTLDFETETITIETGYVDDFGDGFRTPDVFDQFSWHDRTHSQTYEFDEIESAIDSINDFFTPYQPDVDLSQFLEDSDVEIHFDRANQTMVEDINIYQDSFSLNRISGTDVWMLFYRHFNKNFNEPETQIHVFECGTISLDIPDFTSQLDDDLDSELDISEQTIDGSDTHAVTLRENTEEFITEYNQHLSDEMTTHLHEQMNEKKDVTVESLGQENIIIGPPIFNDGFDPFEEYHQRALTHAFEKTLGTTPGEELHSIVSSTILERVNAVWESNNTRTNIPFATVNFDSQPWTERALELTIAGGIPWHAAKVTAIKETGVENQAIANKLDIDDSTVSHHLSNVSEKRQKAEWLTENLDL